jgi:hypothetical protein
MARHVVVGFAFALLTACGSDQQVINLCGHGQSGFDITEASALEDGQSYPEMHDAVILDHDDVEIPEGALWRVRSVDIMALIPAGQFANYHDGEDVTVEVWDADNPNGTPFSVTKPFVIDDLEWDDVSLDNPTTAPAGAQKSAWWTFDFGDEIPTTGMSAANYLVGVAWSADGAPPLGYSNFTRSCAKNWTDYGPDPYYYYDAGWQLNGVSSDGDTCSWPMLKVNLEILQEQAVCDENSVVVE